MPSVCPVFRPEKVVNEADCLVKIKPGLLAVGISRRNSTSSELGSMWGLEQRMFKLRLATCGPNAVCEQGTNVVEVVTRNGGVGSCVHGVK